MYNILKLVAYCVFFLFLFNCKDKTHSAPQNNVKELENVLESDLEDDWVPDLYKTSELAELMRLMFNDHLVLKGKIENEDWETVEVIKYNNLIHSSQPTDADDDTPLFHTYADAFLITDSIVYTSKTTSEYKSNFNLMVDACIACHKNFCMGPINKIELLRIK